MQCDGTERRQLLQGLLCRTGEYRADELAAEGQPAAGRGADRGGGTGAAGHRLSRARLVGRASPGRGDRRRTSTRLAARGAGRIRFMTDAGGHDRLTAMRILATLAFAVAAACARSEEHTSELQSLMRISYAVFCLKKKTITNKKK